MDIFILIFVSFPFFFRRPPGFGSPSSCLVENGTKSFILFKTSIPGIPFLFGKDVLPPNILFSSAFTFPPYKSLLYHLRKSDF